MRFLLVLLAANTLAVLYVCYAFPGLGIIALLLAGLIALAVYIIEMQP